MNIKKLIMTALVAMLIVGPAMAQSRYNDRTRPQQRQTTYRSTPTESTYTRTNSSGNEVYYGLRLGLSLATVNSDVPRWDGATSRAGVNFGGVLGVQFVRDVPLYFETGLFYTQKGGRRDKDDAVGKVHFNLNYLEVPLLLKYSIEAYDDLSFQPFAGGFLALGVGGHVKRYDERITKLSFSDEYFKRFDGGLRIGCGVQYQVLYLDLAYEFGLANIGRDDFEGTHTGCFYINAGVNF